MPNAVNPNFKKSMTHPSASYIKCFIKTSDLTLVGEMGCKFYATLKPDTDYCVEVNLSTAAHDVRWGANCPVPLEVGVRDFKKS
jgi:hypothetical protein